MWSQFTGSPTPPSLDWDNADMKQKDTEIIRRSKIAQGLDPDDLTIGESDPGEVLIDRLKTMAESWVRWARR
jgi:hypothetical protein